jgi:hypothetical protein
VGLLIIFTNLNNSVAGSFKREVWLYDKVDQQKCIEKLEMVDWITLLCQCVINLPKHFSNWQGGVFILL